MTYRMKAISLIAAASLIPVGAAAQNSAAPSAQTVQLRMIEPIGMYEALQTAQRELNGKIVEAEMEVWGGQQVYEVDMLDGKKVREVKISAETGDVLSVRSKKFNYTIGRLLQDDELNAARHSNWSLPDYLTAVETQTGGTVTEIGLDSDDDQVYIEMSYVKDGVERDVNINPQTGSIMQVDFD